VTEPRSLFMPKLFRGSHSVFKGPHPGGGWRRSG
jgi:hypothetical protein